MNSGLLALLAGGGAWAVWAAVRAVRIRRNRIELERQRQFLLDLERAGSDMVRPPIVLTTCEEVSPATMAALEHVAINIATRVRCQVCGRPLIKHASQQRGFGPTCHKRVLGLEITPRDT